MPLNRCPDCGREISDQVPACPNCGRALPKMGILASNVDSMPVAAPSKARRGVLVPVLTVALLVVVGAVVAVLLFAPSPPARVAGVTATPAAAGTSGPASAPSQRRTGNPPINGITCDALESTVEHIHVHLAVFVDGEEIQIPFGIGVGPPLQVADSPAGPFVEDGTCFYWLHTHTEDGVVHIESPIRRSFTLGDFFDIWQQPLSPTQVGPAHGEVIAYLNGARVDTNPHEIPLTQHALIQLDVGGDVPPYPFDFARGD